MATDYLALTQAMGALPAAQAKAAASQQKADDLNNRYQSNGDQLVKMAADQAASQAASDAAEVARLQAIIANPPQLPPPPPPQVQPISIVASHVASTATQVPQVPPSGFAPSYSQQTSISGKKVIAAVAALVGLTWVAKKVF